MAKPFENRQLFLRKNPVILNFYSTFLEILQVSFQCNKG